MLAIARTNPELEYTFLIYCILYLIVMPHDFSIDYPLCKL